MTASGTAGHGAELTPFFDLSELGAVVAKSVRRQAVARESGATIASRRRGNDERRRPTESWGRRVARDRATDAADNGRPRRRVDLGLHVEDYKAAADALATCVGPRSSRSRST